MKYILIIICHLFFSFCQEEKVCRNPSGKEVDWYILFLFPRSAASDGQIYYTYFDSNLKSLEFHLYNESSFPPTFITSYILKNNNTSNYNFFFWNDDISKKDGPKLNTSLEKAHSKGALLYDNKEVIFLSHSLPRFPTRNIKNELLSELPSNTGYYGQHFLCISILKNSADKIVEILNYINIQNIYSIKKDNVNKIENIWVKNLIKNSLNYSNITIDKSIIIESKNGVKFTIFSKNNYDIFIPYDTNLRQNYLDDFYIRTWTRPKLLGAICEKYSLFNVNKLQFGKFKYNKDQEHAKWAISIYKNIICFGDLNHCESQSKRSGILICFEDEALHNIMIDAIRSTDSCSFN